MALLQQLLVNPEAKVVGFAGGKGRSHLANELALELKRAGKKVVMSHLNVDILPGEGHIVFHMKDEELLKQIEKALRKNDIVYAGKKVNDHFIKGITEQFIKKFLNFKKVDHLLLLVGPAKRASILSRKTIDQICKYQFLDQLIYSFEFDGIDQPMNEVVIDDPEDFRNNFPRHKADQNFNQQLIVDYIRDIKNGAMRLFKNPWPALLVFTDVNNPLLENRAINLARDIFSPEIENILLANLRESFIKKVSMHA